jgi:hypothetical protein
MRVLVLTLVVVGGCSAPDGRDDSTASGRAAYVDSAMTIEEGVRRFRDGLPRVTGLTGGAAHRDTLIRRFVEAVERGDTASIRSMSITRAEFAYLYYPASPHSRPPMQQVPGLAWFLMVQDSQKGITRVFDRYAHRQLGFVGHSCEAAPRDDGGFRFWDACMVQLRHAEQTAERRLFGSIIEHEGHYKFLSYANDY